MTEDDYASMADTLRIEGDRLKRDGQDKALAKAHATAAASVLTLSELRYRPQVFETVQMQVQVRATTTSGVRASKTKGRGKRNDWAAAALRATEKRQEGER